MSQNEKSPSSASMKPQGLYYFPQFLTNTESKAFLQELEKNSQWVGISTSQNSRQVIQYGYTYSYTGQPLARTEPIPDTYMQLFQNKLNEPIYAEIKKVLQDWQPEQLLINKYLPGQGISPHIDHLLNFGSMIVCITLGSGVNIKFTRKGYAPYTIYVEPNSLYIMSDEARYQWSHSIDAVKSDKVGNLSKSRSTRISLTFRTVNQN